MKKNNSEWDDWKAWTKGWRYKKDAPYDKEWQEDRRKLFKEAGNGWWYTQGIYRCSDSLKRR
tara:strand:+ start:214 stop:399 length:186 start_codon:yes stop_codon:yes gene_type:complete